MPKVVVKGKVKKFPYTKEGKEEAKEVAKKANVKLVSSKKMMKGKKTKYMME